MLSYQLYQLQILYYGVGCVKTQYIVMCFGSRASSIINLDDDDVNGDNNFVAVDEYVAEENNDEEQWVNKFYP